MSRAFLRTCLGGLLCADQRGATAAEYSLLISLIAAVIFGAVFALGQFVFGLFSAPLGF
jgi:Flp pilus assembly pilin Flp